MIVLHNISGIGTKSGQTHNGNQFTQFFVDYAAEQLDGECAQCGVVIDMGWMNMECAGEEYCFEHVRECKYPDVCSPCERLAEAEIRST